MIQRVDNSSTKKTGFEVTHLMTNKPTLRVAMLKQKSRHR